MVAERHDGRPIGAIREELDVSGFDQVDHHYAASLRRRLRTIRERPKSPQLATPVLSNGFRQRCEACAK